MAWIENKKRSDGGVSARVVWRLGGTDPLTAPPRFVDLGEEYARQIVDLSPGQRKRYLGHLNVLARTRIRGSLVLTKPVTAITESDVKEGLIDWDRSLRAKANHPGLVRGHPLRRGARLPRRQLPEWNGPEPSRVKQSRPELRFLTERNLATAVRLAGPHGDVLTVAVGTGFRFGEERPGSPTSTWDIAPRSVSPDPKVPASPLDRCVLSPTMTHRI